MLVLIFSSWALFYQNEVTGSSSAVFYIFLQMMCAIVVQTWVWWAARSGQLSAVTILHNLSFLGFLVSAPIAPVIDYSMSGVWVLDAPAWLPETSLRSGLLIVLMLGGAAAACANLTSFW